MVASAQKRQQYPSNGGRYIIGSIFRVRAIRSGSSSGRKRNNRPDRRETPQTEREEGRGGVVASPAARHDPNTRHRRPNIDAESNDRDLQARGCSPRQDLSLTRGAMLPHHRLEIASWVMMRTSPMLATVPSLTSRLRLLGAIKAEAKRQGMSMRLLAEKAGIRPENLSRIPGRQDVGFDTLWRLASAVGFDVGLVPPETYGARLEQGLIDPSAFPGFKG